MKNTVSFEHLEPAPLLSEHLGLGGSDPINRHAIGVNSRYLTYDGKPWIPVMGEFHFSRCDCNNWKRELVKMKSGGITLVSTYLFWIYHEENEGSFDFTGNNDIRKFILLCKELELQVIVRLGPWCHGECRNGGFPDWILKKNIPTRKNNPDYMKYAKRLYSAYAEQLKGLYFKDGGPIVCTQVENELVDDAEHLAELVRLAKDCGIITPLYTVTGWNSDQGAKIPLTGVLPVFSGYCDAPWDPNLDKKKTPCVHYFFLPDRNDSAVGADLSSTRAVPGKWRMPYERYPFLTCEIGGGLQSTYHRRYIINPMDVYAMSLVKIASGNNMPGYYVFCGGKNRVGAHSTLRESRATGYPNDYPILNYDYNAPLSADGEFRPHFGLLNLLHMFLRSYGETLAPMNPVFQSGKIDVRDTDTPRCAMRTDGYRGFVFVNHYQRLYPLKNVDSVVIDTGLDLVFPEINLHGDISFLMPFRMPLAGCELVYATAQPLFRKDNTFFFAAIPGINPEYRFEDGSAMRAVPGYQSILRKAHSQIVTLAWEQACGMRVLGNDVCIGEKCNIFGTSLADARSNDSDNPLVYLWKNNGFIRTAVPGTSNKSLPITLTECEPFPIPNMFQEELELGGKQPLTWKQIRVSGKNGFIEIPGKYDVAQLYVNGKLYADKFYDGVPWRVYLTNADTAECKLVMSPWKNGVCYYEFQDTGNP